MIWLGLVAFVVVIVKMIINLKIIIMIKMKRFWLCLYMDLFVF